MQEETPDTTQLKKVDNIPRSITQILKVVEFHRKKIIFYLINLKKKENVRDKDLVLNQLKH